MIRRLGSLLLVTLLWGCTKSPTAPQAGPGEIAAEVTGYQSFEIRVAARNSLTSNRWFIWGGTDSTSIFLVFDGVRPAVGQYTLERHLVPYAAVGVPPDPNRESFNSLHGTITVTESTTTTVAGHFDFKGGQVLPLDDSTKAVEVRGSFNAACEVACQ